MNVNLTDLGVVAALWAVLVLVGTEWFKYRLQASIKNEYDKALELFKTDIKIREQAARVAKLFAMWVALKPDDSRAELHELAWELSLWLPADIVCDITRCLCNVPDAKGTKQILIDVRKHLLRSPNDTLVADNIVHFPQP